MEFEETCTKCNDCHQACPEDIIIIDQQGYPVVDLKRGECTFCNACVDACTPGALVANRPWQWRAALGQTCLTFKGVECRTCQDHCPSQAIRFRLIPGGRVQPQIDVEDCIGCGACAATCPIDAIHFKSISQPAEASPC